MANKQDLVIGVDTATSNRNLVGTLAGTCLAILTFLVFFLYPRASAGEVDPFLFQTALLVIIVAIFSFGFSGLYYYGLMVSLSSGNAVASSAVKRADVFLMLGIFALLLEPALVVFSLSLWLLGAISVGMWIVYISLTILEAKNRTYARV